MHCFRVASPVADDSPPDRRASRFDRPRRPHDWRWGLAGVGRVLISTGVLMFGFVVYQLWGTALQTQAAQRDLDQEYRDAIATGSTLPMYSTTTSVADEPTTTQGITA